MATMSKHLRILFFSPEGDLSTHFAAHCLLARTLQERGHEALLVRCHGCLNWCPVYDARRMPPTTTDSDRQQVCRTCQEKATAMLTAYGLKAVDLPDYSTPELRSTVDQALPSAAADLRSWCYEGIPLGEAALADTAMVCRLSDLDHVEPSARSIWMRYLRAALTCHLLTDRICRDRRIDRLMVFNNYSPFMAARFAASRLGIPSICFTQGGSVDRRRYIFMHRDWQHALDQAADRWPALRSCALFPKELEFIGDELLRLWRGYNLRRFVRAKSRGDQDLLGRLGLSPERPLLVAYTSSLDEFHAARISARLFGSLDPERNRPFADQIAWLQALVDYVAQRSDLQLVVRIHPREGESQRPDGRAVGNLARLQEVFHEKRDRIVFVWPHDAVSSYDLAAAADVALISWSSIGMELARLGVPVLASTMGGIGPYPQDDFIAWADSPDAYFRTLENLLSHPPSLDSVARAHRAFHLYNFALDLGDVVPHYEYPGLPPFQIPGEVAAIERVVVEKCEWVDLYEERLRRRPQEIGEDGEREALRRQLRRYVYYLLTGETNHEDYQLACIAWPGTAKEFRDRFDWGSALPPGLHVLLVNGRDTVHIFADREQLRRSPMLARLARLAAQHRWESIRPDEEAKLQGLLREASPRLTTVPRAGRRARHLFLFSCGDEFLRRCYRATPGLGERNYERQISTLIREHRFWAADLAANLRDRLGLDTDLVIGDAESLQRRWAQENGLDDYPWFEWRSEILAERIRRSSPAVLWILSPEYLRRNGLRRWAPHCGRVLACRRHDESMRLRTTEIQIEPQGLSSAARAGKRWDLPARDHDELLAMLRREGLVPLGNA